MAFRMRLPKRLQDALAVDPYLGGLCIDAKAEPARLALDRSESIARRKDRYTSHAFFSSLRSPLPMCSKSTMSLTRRTRRSQLPMAMSQHLRNLLRTLFQHTRGDQPERAPQGSERSAQFMADGGDELILHALQPPPLGDVLKCDDGAFDAAPIDEWTDHILDGNEVPSERQKRSSLTYLGASLFRLLRIGHASRE